MINGCLAYTVMSVGIHSVLVKSDTSQKQNLTMICVIAALLSKIEGSFSSWRQM